MSIVHGLNQPEEQRDSRSRESTLRPEEESNSLRAHESFSLLFSLSFFLPGVVAIKRKKSKILDDTGRRRKGPLQGVALRIRRYHGPPFHHAVSMGTEPSVKN